MPPRHLHKHAAVEVEHKSCRSVLATPTSRCRSRAAVPAGRCAARPAGAAGAADDRGPVPLVQAPKGKSCKFTYGFVFISGFFSQDNVVVGVLIVKDQVFIEATWEPSVVFIASKFDVIFGLGFKEISVGNVPPIWQGMIDQNLIHNKVFSFWLNRDADDTDGGEIVFGGIDSKHFKGEHTYAPITHKGYRQF